MASKIVSRSIQLTPTQQRVISDAVPASGVSIFLPDRLKGKAAESVVKSLVGKGLVHEVRAKAGMAVWRKEAGTGRGFALVLTKLGRAMAKGAGEGVDEQPVVPASAPKASPGQQPGNSEPAVSSGDTPARRATGADEGGHVPGNGSHAAPRQGSKLGEVIGLLGRAEGASIDELMAATGWLPHTTRAALTGLRKRGYAITREQGQNGAGSRYRMEPAQAWAA